MQYNVNNVGTEYMDDVQRLRCGKYEEEEEEINLYFNDLLHVRLRTFFKYMIQSVIEGQNQKTNMSVYDIPL